MKDWWFSRTPQDRMAIMITLGVVVLLFTYLFLWLPFNKQIEAQRTKVESQIATLEWMERSAAEIKTLKKSGNHHGVSTRNEALLTLVDRTASQNQMRKYIKRLKPQDNDTVQLWLEQTPFDSLIQWLGLLAKQHDIQPESISAERQEIPGLVDARLTLVREPL